MVYMWLLNHLMLWGIAKLTHQNHVEPSGESSLETVMKKAGTIGR